MDHALGLELLREAVSHHRKGDYAVAESFYRGAIALDPANIDANHFLSVIKKESKLPLECAIFFSRSYKIDKGDEKLNFHIGEYFPYIYNSMTLKISEGNKYGYFILAKNITDMEDYCKDESVRKNITTLFHNAAYSALHEDGNVDRAYAFCRMILVWQPNPPWQTMELMHLVDVARGDYAAAWSQGRWRQHYVGKLLNGFMTWDGEHGDAPLVIANTNGFGDFVQFMRFIPEARRRAGTVTVVVPQGVSDLVKTSPLMAGVALVTAMPKDPTGVCCEVVALPLAMGLDDSAIAQPVPYILPPEDLVADWRRLVRRGPRKVIGINWASWSAPDVRSLSYAFFTDMLLGIDADFVGIGAHFTGQQLRDGPFPRNFRFFGPSNLIDTACLLTSLDLFIGPDGGMVHLAAALGVQTWAVLADPGDWRWAARREASDWYETLRLFRQAERGDWAHAKSQVEQSLRAFVQQPHGQ